MAAGKATSPGRASRIRGRMRTKAFAFSPDALPPGQVHSGSGLRLLTFDKVR